MTRYKSGFDWLIPDVKDVMAEYLEANDVEADLSGEFDESMAERVQEAIPDIPASHWTKYDEARRILNEPRRRVIWVG